LAFCKAMIELSRYQDFIINFSAASTARLYKRFPEYNVRIGSGLHVGWAIEGAIGSHRKIDASYLSPHVNNTEYLESSTKAYGVPLLLSEPFFLLLSPAAAKHCRQVDRIRRSEFEDPMGLFTYDADLLIDWNDPNRKKTATMKNRLVDAARKSKVEAQKDAKAAEHVPAGNHVPVHHAARKDSHPPNNRGGRRGSTALMPSLVVAVETEDTAPPAETAEDIEARAERMRKAPTIVVKEYNQDMWMKDEDLVDTRHRVNETFRAVWDNGIAAYIKGDWQKARDVFHETMRLSKKKDGPSKFLMEIIDEHGGTAPHDWPGYRADY
jgi:hypothetical protein